MADWHLSASGMAGVQAGIPACISKRVTTLLLFPSSAGAYIPSECSVVVPRVLTS